MYRRNIIVGAAVSVIAAVLILGYLFYEIGKSSAVISSDYRNPVFEPVLADPSVIRAEDGYLYAYGTEDDWGDGGGSKIVPIIRSKDMVNWEYIGRAFYARPGWMNGGVWAPDVSFFNGKYYLYYTMSVWGDRNPGIGVAVSDAPAGPFEDLGKVLTTEEMGVYSIDPMLFVDGGTPYLFFGGITSGIFGIELSEEGTKTVGDKFQIAGTGYEAPYIIKRGDDYYFFGSAGSCCAGADSTYSVGVARAKSLKGPYLNRKGADLMYHAADVLLMGHFPPDNDQKKFVGPGHNSVITDDNGTDWLVYHAIDVNAPKLPNGASRRPLMIDEIVWQDGWPALKSIFPSADVTEGPAFKK